MAKKRPTLVQMQAELVSPALQQADEAQRLVRHRFLRSGVQEHQRILALSRSRTTNQVRG